MHLSLQHLSQYADEREDILNRIFTGYKSWVDHYKPKLKACFNAMETSQFTFNQKVYSYDISWESYAYHVSGFSENTVSPFSEAW
jgi:hypothetical protein